MVRYEESRSASQLRVGLRKGDETIQIGSAMGDSSAKPETAWTLFWWLICVSLVGAMIGVPWAAAVSGDAAIAWREAGSSLLQLVPACAAGVWLSPRIGLDSRLRELVSRTPGAWNVVRSGFLPGTFVGLGIGTVVFLAVISRPGGRLIPGWDDPTIFEVFLRCLSAGVTEEIVYRFGLMTIVVWAIRSCARNLTSPSTALWAGNLVAALLFGVAHLPGLPADAWIPAVVTPIVMLNAVVGLCFGWLFMRYGLVSAIFAHFVADVVQGVVPRLVALIG
jgi:hypothetical protein